MKNDGCVAHAELMLLLRYDPITGEFWRLKMAKKRGPAGSTTNYGYVTLSVRGTTVFAHRLAWFYVNGVWPTGEIDHINGCRSDNRIENLRACSRTENMRNKKLYKNNKSGHKGVCRNNVNGRWKASIRINGKLIALGQFKDEKDAANAYKAAAEKMFGEFKCLTR